MRKTINEKGQECFLWDSYEEMADYWESRKHEFSFEGQQVIQVMVDFWREEAAKSE